MLIKIKRQKSPESSPYWQSFEYAGSMNATAASVLDWINGEENLTDTDGNPAERIKWECSCMQKMCGACAMVINGTPALACDTFLKDIKSDVLILEPLKKFTVLEDLVVDRSRIYDSLKRAELYIDDFDGADDKEYEHQYLTAKCLKCGLCLEVCPNYTKGEKFFGALFANDAYLACSQSESVKKKLKAVYAGHFAAGCSKSLSCADVCPMGIHTLASIAKMNR